MQKLYARRLARSLQEEANFIDSAKEVVNEPSEGVRTSVEHLFNASRECFIKDSKLIAPSLALFRIVCDAAESYNT